MAKGISVVKTKSAFVFEYLYRDAGNYKASGALLLTGRSIDGVAERLQAKFQDESNFIAEQLGIPALYAELWQYSNGPTEDDHVWHEFHCLRRLDRDEVVNGTEWGSVKALLTKVEAVGYWKMQLSPHWDI